MYQGGSFRFLPSNLKYGETAAIQCTSNAFIAVCFAAVKNVLIWKSWDLDFILDQGEIFKSLSLYHAIAVDELLLSLKIKGSDLGVRMGFRHTAAFSVIMIYLLSRKISFPLMTLVMV